MRTFHERPSGVARAGRVVTLLVLALAAACDGGPSAPHTGSIRVTVVTGGTYLDPNGYFVRVDNGRSVFGLPTNGSYTIPGVERGEHTLRLEGLTLNCSVDGGAFNRVVTVTAGAETVVDYAVTCIEPFGDIDVTVTTDGAAIDPDGYLAELYVCDYYCSYNGGLTLLKSQHVGVDSSLTFSSIAPGVYTLVLSGLAPNCSSSLPLARTVGVVATAVTGVAFQIHCELSGPGKLQFTTATSGPDPDPDGYKVLVASPRTVGQFVSLPTGGAVTTGDLSPGAYTVYLEGVAANCNVVGERKRDVQVASGTTATLAFTVACAPVTQLAFVSERDGNSEIYVANSNGTGLVRLTSNPARDRDPAWSPDGTRIAFTSDRGGRDEVYVMNADGTNVVRRTSGAAPSSAPAWSPDGKQIAFVSGEGANTDVYVIGADDGSLPVRLTSQGGADTHPTWSPDGSKIAFASDRDGGDFHIYTMSPDGSSVVKLTRNGGFGTAYVWFLQPAWSPDGRKIAVVQQCVEDYYHYYACYDHPREGASMARYVDTMNADGSNAAFLAYGEGTTSASWSSMGTKPTWSPDGRAIAFGGQYCSGNSCPVSVVASRLGEGGSWVVDLIVPDGHSPSWRR